MNVTQKESNFILFVFHIFSKCDHHLFNKRLIDKKKDKVDFDITPKTIKDYITGIYGCIWFTDNF